MTDDKGEGEGPYTEIRGWHGDGCDSGCSMDTIEGPGFDKLPQKVFREFDLAMLLNLAHAEGRKAERERCLNVLKKYPDDGKELGDILEAIRLEIKGLI